MLKTWKSSEDYPELTAELLQTEIDQGWIFEFEGDEAEASQQYPCGVGLGMLGIAFSDSRPPRLVLDSSICNANQNCWIPERQCYPSRYAIVRSPSMQPRLTSSPHINESFWPDIIEAW